MLFLYKKQRNKYSLTMKASRTEMKFYLEIGNWYKKKDALITLSTLPTNSIKK